MAANGCSGRSARIKLISHPIKLKKAYPEQRGERPVAIGVGALEAFKVYPMSPVESWSPMQQEINDSVNLRLDHMKQIIARRRWSNAARRSISPPCRRAAPTA
jgi:hypothetical protein